MKLLKYTALSLILTACGGGSSEPTVVSEGTKDSSEAIQVEIGSYVVIQADQLKGEVLSGDKLVYSLKTPPKRGALSVKYNPLREGSLFSLEDLEDGEIRYRSLSNHSEQEDSLELELINPESNEKEILSLKFKT